jgi:hypothetical protein
MDDGFLVSNCPLDWTGIVDLVKKLHLKISHSSDFPENYGKLLKVSDLGEIHENTRSLGFIFPDTQVPVVRSQFNPSNSTDFDRASQRMQTTFAFFPYFFCVNIYFPF